MIIRAFVLFIVTLGFAFSTGTNSHQAFFGGYNHKKDIRSYVDTSSQDNAKISRYGKDKVKLSSGKNYVCKLSISGDINCWGKNMDGVLGDARYSSSATPQAIDSDKKFKELDSGENFNCALDDGDDIYCWGSNKQGQLGIDSKAKKSATPTKIASDVKFKHVYTKEHYACAIDRDGDAYCWGDGSNGEVGNAESGYFKSPQKVKTSAKFKRLTMSDTFVCGVSTDDQVYCWGDMGQDDNGENLKSNTPIKI